MSANSEDTLSVLRSAKELISTPERWTRGEMARDEAGRCVSHSDDAAVSWCIEGAIWRSVKHEESRFNALQALSRELPVELRWPHVFNDYDDTTHADVMELFDRTIAAEEAEGK